MCKTAENHHIVMEANPLPINLTKKHGTESIFHWEYSMKKWCIYHSKDRNASEKLLLSILQGKEVTTAPTLIHVGLKEIKETDPCFFF